ncbi:DUF2550 domain-containing protein [Corynebacterium kozikiae]|uniref:DUF2550 domain-containing protein n=1 Tax=Corynebacterium kozikiae TaxID=2968469 RepID=UPI00211D06A8|nr:DUF2550 domain-containing protein [Corynebacterium sp. 76QC2CO]
MEILVVFLIVIAAVCVALAAWRFFTLHSKGTPAVLRKQPSQGMHGWRNGIFRYKGNNLQFFKVRSLSPAPDLVLHRVGVAITGQRDVEEEERLVLSLGSRILEFTHEGDEYQLCISQRAEMAFRAWVEAAPDARMERMSPKELRARFRES